MSNNALKFKASGKVVSAFYDSDTEKFSLGVAITSEKAKKIDEKIEESGMSYSGDNYPVKEAEDGTLYLKCSTSYVPQLKGDVDEDEYMYTGVGSDVTVSVKMQEGSYKRKRYIACYLLGLNVHTFVEYIPEDVFSNDIEEL